MIHVRFAIVGSGSAGAAAALEASRRGLSVALIEQGQLGGTCLHSGCLPVKSLMANAHRLQETGAEGGATGEVLLADWMSQQRRTVAKLTELLRTQLARREMTLHQGRARLTGPNELIVRAGESETRIRADSIILATGARPLLLPDIPLDEVIGTSERFVALTALPRSLAIIGGGHVGCEFASIFATLGTRVTLLERNPGLLLDMPPEAGEYLHRRFTDHGVRVLLNQPISGKQITRTAEGARLETADGPVEVERVLLAAGRVPNVEGLGLEELGVQVRPRLLVDHTLRTTEPSVFAVGDMNGLMPMAHAAAAQGRLAVRNALGEDCSLNLRTLPVCLYSLPEIARVGLTEAEARASGYEVICGRAQFHNYARAIALGATEGFVDLLADRQTQRLLGGLVIGAQAAELISHLALALRLGAHLHDLEEVNFPHPSFSEALQEAAHEAIREGFTGH
jgi:dihydrolipoamide dehydrogenase